MVGIRGDRGGEKMRGRGGGGGSRSIEGAKGTALKELSVGGKQWREQTEVENVLKETYNNKGKNVIE
jgi:hypothetical protein